MVPSVLCKQQVKSRRKKNTEGVARREERGRDGQEERGGFLKEALFQSTKQRRSGLRCSHTGVWGLKEMILCLDVGAF